MAKEKLTPIEAKMQADYDAIAAAFSLSRDGQRWPEVEAEIHALPAASLMLDIGCGTGRLSETAHARGVVYVGVDISDRQINEARRMHRNVDFCQGSMLHLPFNDRAFDAVFMVASLHHLLTREERLQAVQEAVRVLKPGGKLVVTVMALWQPKFWRLFFQKQAYGDLDDAIKSQMKWNDILLPWKWQVQKPIARYYHAFRRGELRRLFKAKGVEMQSLAYIREGRRVPAWKAKNLVLIGRKTV